MNPVLVFDIETIPDVAGCAGSTTLPAELADDEVPNWPFSSVGPRSGTTFCRTTCIASSPSPALPRRGQFRVFSLSEPDSDEAGINPALLRRHRTLHPQIVSWNGGGFDLPVLHYRGLPPWVSAPRYWEMGEGDVRDARDFKWNNYISRYHSRQPGPDGSARPVPAACQRTVGRSGQADGFSRQTWHGRFAVWGAYQDGQIAEIRDYCETDVGEHLSGVPALPEDARRIEFPRNTRGTRRRASDPVRHRRAALEGLSRRVGVNA
ncbi:3'-5' exonuclease [Nitrogeniibacter mangrovi]|nr:3'-5' exonuclease [Nitrogeniibacter mangrovi]